MHLFNVITENDQYPSTFKIRLIKPLYKAGDINSIPNYCSYIINFNISEIIRKNIENQDYLETNNIIFNMQFGFCSNVSCEHAL